MDSKTKNTESTVSDFTPLKELRGGVVYKIAILGLMLQVLLSLITIISCSMQIGFLQNVQSGYYQSQLEINQAASANDMRHGSIGMAEVSVFVLSGIFILMWIYKAHKNAIEYGLNKEFTAGWAVGSFFVPIINLFRPFQAMVELYTCSESPSNWKSSSSSNYYRSLENSMASSPLLIRLWWALWMVSFFLGQKFFRWDPEGLDEWLNYTYFEIGNSVFDIILTIVFIVVIKKVYMNQRLNFLEQY